MVKTNNHSTLLNLSQLSLNPNQKLKTWSQLHESLHATWPYLGPYTHLPFFPINPLCGTKKKGGNSKCKTL